ncbi:MAG: hypothetical protein P8J50_12475 [Acidimicrobiales bacterium]|nr:hypothetical protein [Acidimicrobiales bacterium]
MCGLYVRLERYELEFVEVSSGRDGREVAPAMHATYLELGKVADEILDRAADHDGVELIVSEHRITWFWAGCVGTAERLTVSSQLFQGERREELLQFSADSLVRSLIKH